MRLARSARQLRPARRGRHPPGLRSRTRFPSRANGRPCHLVRSRVRRRSVARQRPLWVKDELLRHSNTGYWDMFGDAVPGDVEKASKEQDVAA